MNSLFSITLRKDVSNFRDIAQMQKNNPTYLYNIEGKFSKNQVSKIF